MFFTSPLRNPTQTVPLEDTTTTKFQKHKHNFPCPYLLSGAALLGRVNQELVEKVDGLRGRVRDDLLQWDGRILLKGDLVVIGQIDHLLQRGGGGSRGAF